MMAYFAADALTECLGYAACALVLTTFCFSNPVLLRIFALLSNAAFIAFGYLGEIDSIMLLHMVLVPINGFHLAKLSPSPRKSFRSCLDRWNARALVGGTPIDLTTDRANPSEHQIQ
jgi:hypothetical protein